MIKRLNKLKKSTLLVFVLMAFSVFNLNAQVVQVDTKLDTNKILIGDQIGFHLDLLQAKKAKVLFPDLQKEFPKEIEIVEAGSRDTLDLKGKEKLRIRQDYIITSFDSGKVYIPALNFRYEYNGKQDSVRTFPKNLIVQTVDVDTTQTIFDIKGPFGAPLTLGEMLPYIGGFLALALIVLAVYYWLKNRKKKQVEEEVVQKPTEPAHIIALRELDKLKKEKLWQEGKIKLYYTRLTDILRNYLWHRYDIKTLERTTDEILQSLRNIGFDNDELFRKLEDTLHEADLVKFAKWQPEAIENEKNLEVAYEFVNTTKVVKSSKDSEENEEEKTENLKNN